MAMASAEASAEVSSVIVPLPLTRSSMVLMGPEQIMFTQIATPAMAAISAVPLMRRFSGLSFFATTIATTIAAMMIRQMAIK